MRRIPIAVLLFVCVLALVSINSRAQEPSEGTRKLLTRVPPQYPPIARRMQIRGIVKIEAVVSPNGSVKSTELRGGHPLLGQAAQTAIREWKWEPGPRETHEMIDVKFNSE